MQIRIRTSVCPSSLGSRDGILSLNHSVNTIDHILNEACFTHTESSLVRDIVGTVIGLGVLSVDSSDLYVILIGDFVELLLVLAEFWKFDMDGSSHGGTEVGWA